MVLRTSYYGGDERRATPEDTMGAAIDYRLLLAKYIDHVGDAEGASFLDDFHRSYGPDGRFTDGEWAELQRIDRELSEAAARTAPPFPGPRPCHVCGEPAAFSRVLTVSGPVRVPEDVELSCFKHRGIEYHRGNAGETP